jgi:digeranylgeranylglycerophospholipid reductase
MRYDAAVVGNGPAGCFSAIHAAARGDTAIVGARQRHAQCAGLISVTGMDRLGVKARDFVLNRVRGARLYSPGGIEVEIDGGMPKAYAVDRLMFDNHLLNTAVASGAEYVEGRAVSLTPNITLAQGRTIDADRIIVATGTDYTLQIHERLPRPREFLFGGQYEMKVGCDIDFVELHFCVPGFFAWIIPLGDRARVGLCTTSNPRPHLDSFVGKLKTLGRLKSDTILSQTFGIIPIHDPALPTQAGNTVTVGDAAGQVKATTGGGIVYGGLAAAHACLPDYDSRWRHELGGDLSAHLRIHRLLNRLSDGGKDRLFRILREYHKPLEEEGDMDDATKTVKAMFKHPAFVLKMAANLPWLMADML